MKSNMFKGLTLALGLLFSANLSANTAKYNNEIVMDFHDVLEAKMPAMSELMLNQATDSFAEQLQAGSFNAAELDTVMNSLESMDLTSLHASASEVKKKVAKVVATVLNAFPEWMIEAAFKYGGALLKVILPILTTAIIAAATEGAGLPAAALVTPIENALIDKGIEIGPKALKAIKEAVNKAANK
jgi:hypothetical protein